MKAPVETRQISVLDGIEQAVREFPDCDALQSADQVISYRELGARIDDCAGQVSRRTAPGEFIAVAGHRGMSAIVAMAGALKARRPFVVIDERDSAASNQEKVRLLGVRLLARPAAAAAGDDGQVELTEVPARWRGPAGVVPGADYGPGEIGYAVYTSGSTGTPKCVLVRTEALGAVIADHVARLSVGPGSATLQFARLTFDGCLTEIFWTLTAGARLVVLDESRLAPGAGLAGTLERFGITHLKTTPFALTVTEPSAAMCLEHVINGGGPLRYPVLRKWSSAAGVHNAYGLTETTVCNLLSDVLDPAASQESVPLGELVGDCGWYIRDSHDAGHPGGATRRRGELVIAGNSVAAGYLTADGLTPFDRFPTGDVVEVRDGQLHFIERLDGQLKVRGYRLDPGEIENAVCRLGSVSDAVVTAEAHDAGTAGADAVVCYYLGDADPRAVRRHLQGVLDPYKIPSVLERVDAFPYTANGKVDRAALRAGRRAEGSGGEPAAPEQQLLDIVRGLTGVSDIRLEDNFFDLGGDSASAVVLVSRLRELGWVDAGARDVLRAEDLRILAGQLCEWSV
jgi:non-ribosomal peptide synthetase component F